MQYLMRFNNFGIWRMTFLLNIWRFQICWEAITQLPNSVSNSLEIGTKSWPSLIDNLLDCVLRILRLTHWPS